MLHPRLNPSATHVAWTSTREGTGSLGRRAPREAYAASVDGGPVRQLTYWGDRFATVRGWVSDNEVLGRRIIGWDVSRYEEPSSYPVEAPAGRW